LSGSLLSLENGQHLLKEGFKVTTHDGGRTLELDAGVAHHDAQDCIVEPGNLGQCRGSW
jgi:hypothetical protein